MVTEVREIEQKALVVVASATQVKIVDSESYILAGEMWKRLADMEKEAHEHFDPVVKSTDKAHKDAVALRKKVLDPIEGAKTYVKSQMSAYDAEQERIRIATENRLREEARKREEDARINEAVAMEQEGNGILAEMILSEPVETPVVIVQKEVPKMAGGPVYRTVWDAEVTDLMALVKAVAAGQVSVNALLPNQTFLRQQAQSLKETFKVPGCKAYSRRV